MYICICLEGLSTSGQVNENIDFIGRNKDWILLRFICRQDDVSGSSIFTTSFSRIIFNLLLPILLYWTLSSITFLYSRVPCIVCPLISVIITFLKLIEFNSNSIKL
ncbi:hypothetical protein OJ253_3002 [Cryptosporidium canis]|uniref:Uncharacterized protein n=1 Tax=Cryptosporidium canis TaxID=195482 RepID=A0A9D5DEJ6_9CRYT|nr:hypothetical protein OJ253_3002 [Cryptosporidium canis]